RGEGRPREPEESPLAEREDAGVFRQRRVRARVERDGGEIPGRVVALGFDSEGARKRVEEERVVRGGESAAPGGEQHENRAGPDRGSADLSVLEREPREQARAREQRQEDSRRRREGKERGEAGEQDEDDDSTTATPE